MDPSSVQFYCCPADRSPLRLENADSSDEAFAGDLVSASGRRYPIDRGVPNFVSAEHLNAGEIQAKAEYDRTAEEIYDRAMEWQFAALHEDEEKNRALMLSMLEIEPAHRVLEVGCGTGRDTFRLARRLDQRGALFMQDISAPMVHACRRKMTEHDRAHRFRCALHYSISSALHLPFPDGLFDRVFHFGGFNQFGDLQQAALELTRVVKPGGKVLYGDEAVAPWLKGTEFDQIVCTNNPLFRHEAPLASIPSCARDVMVRWIIGNCFYVIAFSKGEGPPPLNLDLPHAGTRGGTMRTRYYGNLEGVTPEAKELVRKAASKAGVSVHEWLDRSVRGQAAKELDGKLE